MTASHDRVRFKFKDNPMNQRSTCEAAVRAFGLTPAEAQKAWDYEDTIICRPSQFARFLIYRSETCVNNAFAQFDFAQFEAELFTPPPKTRSPRDVSCNFEREYV